MGKVFFILFFAIGFWFHQKYVANNDDVVCFHPDHLNEIIIGIPYVIRPRFVRTDVGDGEFTVVNKWWVGSDDPRLYICGYIDLLSENVVDELKDFLRRNDVPIPEDIGI